MGLVKGLQGDHVTDAFFFEFRFKKNSWTAPLCKQGIAAYEKLFLGYFWAAGLRFWAGFWAYFWAACGPIWVRAWRCWAEVDTSSGYGPELASAFVPNMPKIPGG